MKHGAKVASYSSSLAIFLTGLFLSFGSGLVGEPQRPANWGTRKNVAFDINNSYGDLQESGLLGPVRLLRVRESR